jgi:hypothetical protein
LLLLNLFLQSGDLKFETGWRHDEENKHVDLIYISVLCPFMLVNTKTFYDTCRSNIVYIFSRKPMRLKLLASLSEEIRYCYFSITYTQ